MTHNFIFLGHPGAGKGFFAQLISKRLGYVHFCIGDEIRRITKEQSNKDFDSVLSSGKLLPDEMVNEIMSSSLKAFDPMKVIIVDGFPRTLSQAKYLDEHHKSFKVIKFDLDKTVTVNKLLGRRTCVTCNANLNVCDIRRDGFEMPAILPDKHNCRLDIKSNCSPKLICRSDDTSETILNRFKIYEEEITPIVKYYSSRNLLKEFIVRKGEKDIDHIIRLMEE